MGVAFLKAAAQERFDVEAALMCAAMAPSGGRSPYGGPVNNTSLNEAAAYAYELEGGAATGGASARNSMYDSRTLAAAGYDVRSKHAPPMATPAGYYPNEEEAHFGPPGTGSTYGDYGDGGYYGHPQRPPRGGQPQQAGWGYGGGHPQMVQPQNSGGFIEDEEYVTAFSDEEADDMDSRLSRVQGGGGYDSHSRAKSLLRFNELERERSRRRTAIVKQKTSSKLFPGKLKLSMMNTGLIPLKKAEGDSFTTEFYANPVGIADFEKHCIQRRKYPVLLQIEFNNATKEHTDQNTRVGSKKNNVEKNQNPRIVPYDHNRVILEPEEGVPDSDYINASYVDSLVQPKAYIVTQGPTETTIGDFWRMVWQERCSCIVMVTRTFDFIRVMCVQYWPAGKNRDEVYSGIGVTVENEEQLANFMIRTIRMRKNGEERKVILFHYTEWPCHSNPFSNALLEFRRRVRNVMNHHPDTQDGPVIVHCNDGAGRSGVYLAIDANIELSEEDGVFDVYGYLTKMRQQRRGLVETLEQLKFIYDTLEESVVCGYTFFPVKDISLHLKQKSVRPTGGGRKSNQYEKEYGLISHQTPR